MKLLMVINPKSGTKNSKTQLIDAIDVFCKNGYTVTTYVTQAKLDAYNYLMKNKIKYDVVCVFGGDGTINEVSNALMNSKQKPLLGYFPSGTMNDFGSNFDLGSDFKQIATKIVEGNKKAFDVAKVNDSYFNYVAAFGALCDVPYTTNRDTKEKIGSLAYILQGISKINEIKKYPIKYTINKKEYKKDVLFGLVYSGNRVSGIELEDKTKARIDDGMLNVLIVDYVPTIFNSPALLETIIENKRHIHRYRVDKMSIEFEDDNVPFTLDGEKADVGKKVNIRVYKKALKLLA